MQRICSWESSLESRDFGDKAKSPEVLEDAWEEPSGRLRAVTHTELVSKLVDQVMSLCSAT